MTRRTPPVPLDQTALDAATGGFRRGNGPSADLIMLGPGGGIRDPLGGNDHLFGTGGDDTIEGRGGEDHTFGEGGNDLILWSTGHGNETVDGGAGRDTLSIPAAYVDSMSIHGPDGAQVWDGSYTAAPGGGYVIELPVGSGYLELRDPANPSQPPVRIEFSNLERVQLR